MDKEVKTPKRYTIFNVHASNNSIEISEAKTDRMSKKKEDESTIIIGEFNNFVLKIASSSRPKISQNIVAPSISRIP